MKYDLQNPPTNVLVAKDFLEIYQKEKEFTEEEKEKLHYYLLVKKEYGHFNYEADKIQYLARKTGLKV